MKVLKNIPMPEVKSGIRTNAKPELDFVNYLEVGDCVEFNFSDAKWKTNSDTVRRKMRRKGFKVMQRKYEDKLLVWRVK